MFDSNGIGKYEEVKKRDGGKPAVRTALYLWLVGMGPEMPFSQTCYQPSYEESIAGEGVNSKGGSRMNQELSGMEGPT